MTSNSRSDAPDARWPAWVSSLARGKSPHYTASGHAWLRFHRWAYQRFPANDVSRVSRQDERELFSGLKAPIISYHYEPEATEHANAFLYICRDKNYDVSLLSPNNRSKVRRGLKRLQVRRATPQEVAATGYACARDASLRNGMTPMSEEAFRRKWQKGTEEPFRDIWAAFAGDTIAAVGIVWVCGRWVELVSTQSADAHLKDYPNHALFYTVLQHYLQREEVDSVSYGLSSVQSDSHVDSLHHFKLSVRLDAVPVVRKVRVAPPLRLAVNRGTLKVAAFIHRKLGAGRHLSAARGALELMLDSGGRLPSPQERPHHHSVDDAGGPPAKADADAATLSSESDPRSPE